MKKFELTVVLFFFPLMVLLDFVVWNIIFGYSRGFWSLFKCMRDNAEMVIRVCDELNIGVEEQDD